MKKLLIGTSALVAAGMVAAPGAQAADPIKLGLGGFFQQWIGFSNQDASFESASGTAYDSFDIKTNSEVFVKGSTKLDNGITVGVQIEFEADTDTAAGTPTLDHSYLYLTSPTLGQLILGDTDNAATKLRVTAPEAGNNLQGSHQGIASGPTAATNFGWTVRPTDFSVLANSFDVTDRELIGYISPSFSGFKAAITYMPDSSADDDIQPSSPTGDDNQWSIAAQYDGKFEGVGIKATAGYSRYNEDAAQSDTKDWNAGLSFNYAGFTLGGSYFNRDADTSSPNATTDGYATDLGLMYASGPYAVSLNWYRSDVEGTAQITRGDNDVMEIYALGGKYNLGPGVDLKGAIATVTYDGEVTNQSSNNDGWSVTAGVTLGF